MRLGGITRQAANRAASTGLPVRCEQPGERRHEVDATVVLHLPRQGLDLSAVADEIQIVAQPLYQRTRYGDASFERVVRRLLAELICDRRKQSEFRLYWLETGIHQEEATCAIGVLRLSRLETRLPHQRSLLVSQVSAQRSPCQWSGRHMTVHLTAGRDARQHRRRNAKQSEDFFVPRQSFEIH